MYSCKENVVGGNSKQAGRFLELTKQYKGTQKNDEQKQVEERDNEWEDDLNGKKINNACTKRESKSDRTRQGNRSDNRSIHPDITTRRRAFKRGKRGRGR